MIQAANQQAAIDWPTLRKLENLQMDGEPDILLEVINSFLQTTSRRILAISEFVDSGNNAGIAKEAHVLKSSSLALGALSLGKLCQKLEDLGEINDITNLRGLFESLEKTYRRSCKELVDIKEKKASGKIA